MFVKEFCKGWFMNLKNYRDYSFFYGGNILVFLYDVCKSCSIFLDINIVKFEDKVIFVRELII